jgi:hypothetical protein
MITRSQKLAAIGATALVTAGVATWIRSGPAAPRPAAFAPGQAVIEDSEMSPTAFKERRRKLVESQRAGAGEGAAK